MYLAANSTLDVINRGRKGLGKESRIRKENGALVELMRASVM